MQSADQRDDFIVLNMFIYKRPLGANSCQFVFRFSSISYPGVGYEKPKFAEIGNM